MSENPTTALAEDGLADLRRALDALKPKHRLRVLDGLSDGLITNEDGVRFACRSVVEYRRIKKRKPWDEPIRAWIEGFRRGDVFYDIGANVGAFALLAARRHGAGIAVVAIEPAADTFAALTRNILVNQLERVVTPLQVGLFDATAIRAFHYHELGAGKALHALGEPIDSRRRRFTPAAVVPVLAFALDDLVDRFTLPRPTRIKLDVDGMESRVLAGAVRTLTAGPSEIWVELTEMREDDPVTASVRRELHGMGFEEAQRVDHYERRDYPRVFDVLFRRA